MLTRLIYRGTAGQAVEVERVLSQYHTAVSALLLTSAPKHFPGACPVIECIHRLCTLIFQLVYQLGLKFDVGE